MPFRVAIARRWGSLRKSLLRRFVNLWPPYLASGIRVRRLDLASGVAEVQLKLHFWNRNYVGTHYGGSLYSMCDPWYMLILIERLGRGFVVWDKAATIRFRRPGRGIVRARFEVMDEDVARIRAEALRDGKTEAMFTAKVIDAEGKTIAEVDKVVHVRAASEK